MSNVSIQLLCRVEEPDGGPQSFPRSIDTQMAMEYGYRPTNGDYDSLFTNKARQS